MKPTPLNANTRKLIVDEMVHRAYDDKIAAAHKAVADAFEVYYRTYILTEEQEKIVATLPECMFNWRSEVAMKVDYHDGSKHYSLNRRYALPAMYNAYQEVGRRGFEGREILMPAVKAADMVYEERKEARVKFENFIKNFRTTRQLYDEWPQGKEIYKDIVEREPPVRNLPAIPVRVINDALGLS